MKGTHQLLRENRRGHFRVIIQITGQVEFFGKRKWAEITRQRRRNVRLMSLRPRQMEYNVGIRSRSQIKIELGLYLVRQRPLFRVINTFFWEVYSPTVCRMGWIIKKKRQKDQLESDSSNCLASRKYECLNLENDSGRRKK